MKKRILILGGGFAGAYTALHLERRLGGLPDVEILLAAQENFVLFTPMLHEVAAGDVAVTDVVQPFRKMLRRTRVLIVEIKSIDLAGKSVRIVQPHLAQAFDIAYDHLVLAFGTVPNFHRTPGVEEHDLTMKTLGDAILLRNRIIESLDVADNHPDEVERKTMLTVVVAGGGFAGVETAGAVNDLLRAAVHFYPNVKEDMLRIRRNIWKRGGDPDTIPEPHSPAGEADTLLQRNHDRPAADAIDSDSRSQPDRGRRTCGFPR
uniref:NADH:ubiquinone reductase (non-electrogenic) n=1 Tax=Solibacter usitatus (strain Ellin6076) TaxID=234267 RepID=Q01VY4_SOLUE